ncbi:ABC transporter [Brachyspira hampsonii 30446]|uniref:Cell division ATP-binding protein FtsE n=1 Tax=Brachyspira hampsonii 30446 TaxID=1289135 RepID=A0A2U4F3N4_9SPIR|nr:ATP-binding cassette domain-containing protein [Brachyspira hampsonii]EKV58099.1 ABC transporter [Brachyspira hampsonii 30446]MBW5393610.1 ATP-binding cassette domain-containing protein [Brachyspira hampsonii]OEJ19962.1 methionine ABC transporter ATP-binding protein [Brachyspira hampsonii]
MIVLENVSKVFKTAKNKQLNAVNNVSLKINKGEIYGIIGFSGAGKSTLVRCINLLERPTSGKVYVDEEELTSLKPKELREKRKKMGMIFQQFNLFSSRTVFKNVAYPLRYRGLSKEEIEKKVMSLLELVDIKEKANVYPSQLSGGQKQRVAIARALANDPQILLCDEATSALDPQTTSSILKLLKKLNEDLGITIVVITHEMNVVKELCHRVAVMNKGSLIEEGDIFEVFSHPKNQITQEFIDTTSNLSKIYTLVEEKDKITNIKAGECIVRLKYKKDSVGEALVSHVSRKFNVDVNIIFGNVELIDDSLLGGLVVILHEKEKGGITNTIKFFQEQNVDAEVIKDARYDE